MKPKHPKPSPPFLSASSPRTPPFNPATPSTSTHLTTNLSSLFISPQNPTNKNTSPYLHQPHLRGGGKKGGKGGQGRKVKDVVKTFKEYFGDPKKFVNWERMCRDLGIEGELSSITQCRKALIPIWVNIHDFLHQVNGGQKAKHFKTEKELAAYTFKHRLFYPKEKAKKDGPVRALLAHIIS